jgi:hypothetical protein
MFAGAGEGAAGVCASPFKFNNAKGRQIIRGFMIPRIQSLPIPGTSLKS